jgi:imidazolonepropionase-like amidohydrolase
MSRLYSNSVRLFTTAFFLLAVLAGKSVAQNKTTNAEKPFAIKNVRLHIGNGKTIENGAIGVKNGKIAVVTANASELSAADYPEIIDGKGQDAYPSFIAPNTQLGLVEIEAVRSTRDFAEVGHFNPNIRSLIAYNTDSEILPTVYFNGVLVAQTVPQGGRISGQSSVVQLRASNWEDAVVAADNGVHLNFPARFHYTGWWAEPGKIQGYKGYEKDMMAIKMYFDEAKAYMSRNNSENKNLKFEVMRSVLERKKKLFLHVDEALAITEAIDLFKPYNLDIVIVGGAESYMVADLLKANNIAVIYMNVHDLPTSPDMDTDQMYKTPAMLQKAGVKFCIGLGGSWQVRNLPFVAGNAAAYGLGKNEALSAITLRTAEILGIADRLGSLEVGKDATFFLSKGDALDMRTSIVGAAYIQGKPVLLSSRQQVLYDKYMDKFGLEKK